MQSIQKNYIRKLLNESIRRTFRTEAFLTREERRLAQTRGVEKHPLTRFVEQRATDIYFDTAQQSNTTLKKKLQDLCPCDSHVSVDAISSPGPTESTENTSASNSKPPAEHQRDNGYFVSRNRITPPNYSTGSYAEHGSEPEVTLPTETMQNRKVRVKEREEHKEIPVATAPRRNPSEDGGDAARLRTEDRSETTTSRLTGLEDDQMNDQMNDLNTDSTNTPEDPDRGQNAIYLTRCIQLRFQFHRL